MMAVFIVSLLGLILSLSNLNLCTMFLKEQAGIDMIAYWCLIDCNEKLDLLGCRVFNVSLHLYDEFRQLDCEHV